MAGAQLCCYVHFGSKILLLFLLLWANLSTVGCLTAPLPLQTSVLSHCCSLLLGALEMSKWGEVSVTLNVEATVLWEGEERLPLLYYIDRLGDEAYCGTHPLHFSEVFKKHCTESSTFMLPSSPGIKFEPIGAVPQDYSQWQMSSYFNALPLGGSYTGLCSFGCSSLLHLNKPDLGVLRSQVVAGQEDKHSENIFLLGFWFSKVSTHGRDYAGSSWEKGEI